MKIKDYKQFLKQYTRLEKENKEMKDRLDESRKIDTEKMDEWLKSLSLEHGFRDYYTVRKRALHQAMANGIQGDSYWKLYGQMDELKYMKELSTKLIVQEKKKKEVKK